MIKRIAASVRQQSFYGSRIGIRTPTNRVRVCRATVTQFRISFITAFIIPKTKAIVNPFLRFSLNISYDIIKKDDTTKKDYGSNKLIKYNYNENEFIKDLHRINYITFSLLQTGQVNLTFNQSLIQLLWKK